MPKLLHAEIPYSPRSIWQSFHDSNARFRVVVAHRRAGKTVAGLNELIRACFRCPHPNPHFAYIGPFLGQAKDTTWAYLKRFASAVPGTTFNESELRCDFPNGARIRVYGADNHPALRGHYFDGVVCDEFGDWDSAAWLETIRPALADRKGWAAFPGTPRGRNAFYDLRERARRGEAGWQLWELKASESGILPESELADALKDMGQTAYDREFEISFDAPVEGAYYGREMAQLVTDKRIRAVPVDPLVTVDTAWDLGIDDATAIWFVQDVGRERRLIDYLEVTGEGLPDIVRRLEEKNYRYRRHILPQDVQVRELGTGKSRIETLRSLGLNAIDIAPNLSVSDGINAVRLMLGQCWFDEERCARGLDALRQYRRVWDDKRKVWSDLPFHDWASHAADAMRYLALTRNRVSLGPRNLSIPNFGVV